MAGYPLERAEDDDREKHQNKNNHFSRAVLHHQQHPPLYYFLIMQDCRDLSYQELQHAVLQSIIFPDIAWKKAKLIAVDKL